MHELTELSDITSESGLIGTLILHPEFLENTETLQGKHFFDKVNGAFFWGIKELYLENITTIDEYNLTVKFNSNDGIKRLIEANNVDIEDAIELYSQVGRDKLDDYMMLFRNVYSMAYKRDLVMELDRTINRVYREKEEGVVALNNYVSDHLDELADSYVTNGKVERFGKKVNKLWENIKSRRNVDGTVGIPTKFKNLQKFTTYRKGELVMIAGRMKSGKSIVLTNECLDKAIVHNTPTAYFDTEMSDELFLLRMVSNLTGIPIERCENGNITPEEDIQIEKALERIEAAPLVHEYDTSITMDEVYMICKSLQRTMNLQFIIYDYLKYDGDDASTNYNRLGQMTNALKNDIAGKLDLPVLSAVQINRNGDIADSDKIARYASTLIQIERKPSSKISRDGEDCGNYMAKVIINRNGAMTDLTNEDDYIDLMLDAQRMRFYDAKKHNAAPEF